ncbi:MAG: HmuY family protein [Chitinophagaceae bacterium]|nr:HmuY family protein [Chitinophagaceae bacterium]
MKNRFLFMAVCVFTAVIASCKKTADIVVIVPPPTDVKTQTLSGGAGGSNAPNSVFIDMSNARQDSVPRASWDLAFYGGADFRVTLNFTSGAGVKITNKNDLMQVGAADTIGLTLSTSQLDPQPGDLAYFDDLSGDIGKTVIPAISATDAENKVIILNRGAVGGIAPRPWIKLRILRNSSGGYTLHYAGIKETTIRTVNIPKDAEYNFKFVSLNNGGSLVNVEPEKTAWDFEWTYSIYKANFGGGDVPYPFSDIVAINTLGGVQVAQVMTSTVSFADYKEANITGTSFSNNRWVIGSNWRATTGTVGVRTDRFYVLKDPTGNVYKLRFISFHASDGGVRGYPVVEYKLVKPG